MSVEVRVSVIEAGVFVALDLVGRQYIVIEQDHMNAIDSGLRSPCFAFGRLGLFVLARSAEREGKGITVRNLLTIASGDANLSKDKCCKYLTQVGLCANDYLDREVDVSLSGGEVKRIEIATILARQGSLMIFDEPEAGIDLWSFARLTETFEQIHEQHRATMIIISHQERIIRLADEIVVISGGQIAHRGNTEEIFPLILADTLGGCPVLEHKEVQL